MANQFQSGWQERRDKKNTVSTRRRATRGGHPGRKRRTSPLPGSESITCYMVRPWGLFGPDVDNLQQSWLAFLYLDDADLAQSIAVWCERVGP